MKQKCSQLKKKRKYIKEKKKIPLIHLPWIKIMKNNEKYTNLLMPISAFSMTENFMTTFTFVFLLIHDKLVNLEKKFSSKTHVHVFSTVVKFKMMMPI